jgi:hypothetical protein
MANEGGEWIMKGLDWDNPYRIRSWRELINWINEVGFLPLFANEVPGFELKPGAGVRNRSLFSYTLVPAERF